MNHHITVITVMWWFREPNIKLPGSNSTGSSKQPSYDRINTFSLLLKNRLHHKYFLWRVRIMCHEWHIMQHKCNLLIMKSCNTHRNLCVLTTHFILEWLSLRCCPALMISKHFLFEKWMLDELNIVIMDFYTVSPWSHMFLCHCLHSGSFCGFYEGADFL